MAGKKKLVYPRAKVDMVDMTLKGCFIKETSKINKICGFAGPIKSFRGPHLAR